MKLDKNNITLVSADNIKQIIAPLLHFNINYMGYTKAYSDGSRVRLWSDAAYTEAWFAQKFYLQGNGNAKIELYDSQAIISSTLPNQSPIKWGEENFKIAHGIHLINKHEDYCEFFMFATTPDHPEVINFYLNHLDFLERFSRYFKTKAADLIKKAERQKIITPFHNQGVKAAHPPKIQELDYLFKGTRIAFSLKQQQCIDLLLQGLSAKQIAAQLHLSPRTVEDYLDSIKAKLNVRTKAELIIKLIELA